MTSTIVDWLPVFQTPACCDILVGSLGFCQREKGLRLYAWVILDNHFHAVVSSEQLPRVMADLKKFTAGKLIAQLEAERRTWLLDLLAARKGEHETSSTYQLQAHGLPSAGDLLRRGDAADDPLRASKSRPTWLGGIARTLVLQFGS